MHAEGIVFLKINICMIG